MKIINGYIPDISWMREIAQYEETKKLLKTRIYLKPQESPPKGITTHRGPRGGLYYETKTPMIRPALIKPVKIDIDYTQDPELFEEPLFVGFIENLKKSVNLHEQLRYISKYKELFIHNIKDTDPKLYNKIEKVRHALYRHVKFVIRQHELEKLGKAHVDVKIFRHKIRLFDKVKNAEESLDTVSKVSSSCKLDTGCNATQKVRFSNSGVIDAIFKPLDGEYANLRDGIDTLYNREVCAYELDQLFGLNMVPETFYKTIQGKVGSAQKWISDTEPSSWKIATKKIYSDDALRLTIFDYLISNTDRHSGNYLLKKDPKSDKYHIIAIDNGCSMSTTDYSDSDALYRSVFGDYIEFDEIPNSAKILNEFISVPWIKIQEVLIKHKIQMEAIEICKRKFELLRKIKRIPKSSEVLSEMPL